MPLAFTQEDFLVFSDLIPLFYLPLIFFKKKLNQFSFSVWNLVTIALERYLAVCKPFKYANFTKSKVMKIFIGLYIMSIICSGGCSFQVTIAEIHNL